MDKINTKSWEEELIAFLIEDGITDQSFYEYVKTRIIRLPLKVEEFGWGVFPKIDSKGIIYDIRILIPTIYDELSLRVNIHEYTHAYELYNCLGKKYEWNVKKSEEQAREAEKRYLNKKKNGE